MPPVCIPSVPPEPLRSRAGPSPPGLLRGVRDDLDGHALLLDVDGTLLDLAPTPEAVEVPRPLIPALQRLRTRLGGAVAFVSGRPIASVDALFQPLKLPAIGVHGGEMRFADGPVIVDTALQSELQAVEPLLRQHAAALRGVMLENKGCAIALHYRAAPEQGREVLKLAELVVSGMSPDFAVLLGKCVVEIRPRRQNKGAGIARLMEQAPFRGRTPIFAGDDVTDEDAFEFVNRVGGISIRVGKDASGSESLHTAARYRLGSPQLLRDWVIGLAA